MRALTARLTTIDEWTDTLGLEVVDSGHTDGAQWIDLESIDDGSALVCVTLTENDGAQIVGVRVTEHGPNGEFAETCEAMGSVACAAVLAWLTLRLPLVQPLTVEEFLREQTRWNALKERWIGRLQGAPID